MRWPRSEAELTDAQRELAGLDPRPWRPPAGPLLVAGCFVCFARGVGGPGAAGDRAWAAAALVRSRARLLSTAAVGGVAGAPYVPGLLALREGRLLEAAIRALDQRPDVIMVDATARDHPRGAGLALHLGWMLDLPSVGVTDRPLVAGADPPGEERGATSPLELGGEVVGCWLRTRRGARPVAVHPGWRTGLDVAIRVVLSTTRRARTPEPLRRARREARQARAAEHGRPG